MCDIYSLRFDLYGRAAVHKVFKRKRGIDVAQCVQLCVKTERCLAFTHSSMLWSLECDFSNVGFIQVKKRFKYYDPNLPWSDLTTFGQPQCDE